MPDTAIAAAPYRRFSLLPDGIIACQLQETNPLPGPSVARLAAGPHWTLPSFEIIAEGAMVLGLQPGELEDAIRAWLPTYIAETLPFLKEDPEAPEAVKALLAAIADQGGMAERAKLTMPELDTGLRFYLRQKGLRLGPVHLYYQNLLKPAPLTLRALLWATHTGLAHPIPYPRPGVTSYTWPEGVTPNAEVQHWLGYPLYAKRGCRVDRIDKIICDVYETAAKGAFTVKNAWAEWLGCKVEDIVTLLEELGHTRTSAVPAEGDEEAAKKPIEFRLKSDRPVRVHQIVSRPPREPRADRPERKPKGERKDRGAPSKDGKVHAFKKKDDRGERKPAERKPKDEPMVSNPFANLKDMLGG